MLNVQERLEKIIQGNFIMVDALIDAKNKKGIRYGTGFGLFVKKDFDPFNFTDKDYELLLAEDIVTYFKNVKSGDRVANNARS